jgi:hypothetical protein
MMAWWGRISRCLAINSFFKARTLSIHALKSMRSIGLLNTVAPEPRSGGSKNSPKTRVAPKTGLRIPLDRPCSKVPTLTPFCPGRVWIEFAEAQDTNIQVWGLGFLPWPQFLVNRLYLVSPHGKSLVHPNSHDKHSRQI